MYASPIKWITAVALVAAGLAFAGSQQQDESDSQHAPRTDTFDPMWLDDLELATSIAAERDRPLMVVFR